MSDKDKDGQLDRRHFLHCMAGRHGRALTLSSGVLRARPRHGASRRDGCERLALRPDQRQPYRLRQAGEYGCDGNVACRDREARAEPDPPSFVLHTGDLTHLSKPAEFDTLQQVLSDLSMPVFYVPGEHDVLGDDGRSYP